MSHFSTIKTKIKNKPELIEALQLLQYDVQEDQELVNPINHQHENTDDFHSLFSWRFFISGQNTCNRTTERMDSSSNKREKPHN